MKGECGPVKKGGLENKIATLERKKLSPILTPEAEIKSKCMKKTTVPRCSKEESTPSHWLGMTCRCHAKSSGHQGKSYTAFIFYAQQGEQCIF